RPPKLQVPWPGAGPRRRRPRGGIAILDRAPERVRPDKDQQEPAVSSDSRDRGEWTESAGAIRPVAAGGKGGRRFSFHAVVVVGNGRGHVAWGYGKANEVPPAVEKGVKDAHKQMKQVNLRGGTIPHRVTGKYGAARVVMIPASPGTGVIAGGAVRAVVQAAG